MTDINLQTNQVIRWSFYALSILFIVIGLWLWQMTSSIQMTQRDVDRFKLISENNEKDIIHLRSHADSSETSIRSFLAQQNEIIRRMSELEGKELNAIPPFTKRDGESLIEVIRGINFRLEKLEEKMQLIIDRAIKRLEDTDVKGKQ